MNAENKRQALKIPSLSDFEIGEALGKGGFSRVYLARKHNNKSDVFAIKFLNKQFIKEKNQSENVVTERNILAMTSCPFVVNLYYTFETTVLSLLFNLKSNFSN